jgi:hypothetical protein
VAANNGILADLAAQDQSKSNLSQRRRHCAGKAESGLKPKSKRNRMKVKVCRCEQCRAKKRSQRGNYKKRVKRMLNRMRRRGNDDKIINWYWS